MEKTRIAGIIFILFRYRRPWRRAADPCPVYPAADSSHAVGCLQKG